MICREWNTFLRRDAYEKREPFGTSVRVLSQRNPLQVLGHTPSPERGNFLLNIIQLHPTSSNFIQHLPVDQHYNVIGLMSGSSLDGLDIAYVRLSENGTGWSNEWIATACVPYTEEWSQRLRDGINLNARDLAYLHADYGHFLGRTVREFLAEHPGFPKPDLIASHGHTLFHDPALGMTCQIGNGAAIAAETGIQTVSDLRNLDVAYGGQGAPIVPLGERLLFPGFEYYLNLGGIANITESESWNAYDVCACNQVLNTIANRAGMAFDAGGELASIGTISVPLYEALNAVAYHHAPVPKSLDNSFSVREILPLFPDGMRDSDLLRTATEHIAFQICEQLRPSVKTEHMLITGGGALNTFLIARIRERAAARGIEITVPDRTTIEFKEALVMALLGVLRLRGEATTIASVTGARGASSGGALWLPVDAVLP